MTGLDLGLVTASVDEYMTMVIAGLAGKTPHMISATIMALARLVFELSRMPIRSASVGTVLLHGGG